jgi:hypothetical protein
MIKKVIFSFLVLIIVFPFAVFGDSFEAGAVFMLIFPGSRATGMAGASTASEGDVFSTYYNDAALSFNDGAMIGLQHANWLSGLYPGMYYEYFSLLLPVGEDLNFDFAVTYLTTGETVAGDSIDPTRYSWVTFDLAVKAAGCLQLSNNLGVGVGMKYIYSFLAPEDVIRQVLGIAGSGGSGQAWAVDLSVLYVWNDFIGPEFLKTLRLGAALQNLGPNISYIENGESDPLARTLRLGVSASIFENEMNKLNLNLDLIKILIGVAATDFGEMWKDSWKAGGLEYTVRDLFSARVGYFLDRVGDRNGFTYGIGLNLYKKFLIDISADQDIYDFPTQNYRISLQYSF